MQELHRIDGHLAEDFLQQHLHNTNTLSHVVVSTIHDARHSEHGTRCVAPVALSILRWEARNGPARTEATMNE